MSTRVCVAGATGWVGRALVPAIVAADDLELTGAVSRRHAGQPVGAVLGLPDLALAISGSVEEALRTPADVLVDFTTPEAVKGHVLSAIERGVNVVVGTSGLTDQDYAEIAARAEERGAGVLAAGNFAITAVLMMRFAEIAARYLPHWEIIDYAGAGKVDAPSGTARELAARLGAVRRPELEVPISATQGVPETRGGTLNGTQIHAVRLPSYTLSVEALFGLADERLTLRHDAGAGAEPYIQGTLLAIRCVTSFTGLKRGLDSVMDL